MYENSTSAQFIRPHDYSTRGHDYLLPQSARLELTKHSISVVGPNTWRSIPEDIRNSPSRNSFKFSYKKFLLSFYGNDQSWLIHRFWNNCSVSPFLYSLFISGNSDYHSPKFVWSNMWHSRSPLLTRCKPISWSLFAL